MVSLTTLHQPCADIGTAAVTAMLRGIDNRKIPAQDVNLDCPLIVRESCGIRSDLAEVTRETRTEEPQ